jgi:hypothetical protein
MLAAFVNRHDSRMIETRSRFGFGPEPLDVQIAGHLPGQNHLQGYYSIKFDLTSLVNDPHSSTSNFLDDLVVAKYLVGWTAVSFDWMNTTR